MNLKNFRIDADSASGLTEAHAVSIATPQIERVKFTNRWDAALKWAGGTVALASLTGLTAGLIDDSPVMNLGLGFFTGVLASPLGAGVGALGGVKTYQFK